MRRTASLRIATAVIGLGLLTSCSTGSTDDTASDAAPVEPTTSVDADAFPVTIEHAYGETTIEEEPARVATVGWSDHDTALALGVVPVGATAITWGGNEEQSTPWFDEELAELGAEQPVRYSDVDGTPVDEVAKVAPDLILATNSGLTKAEYEKLSKIAPVVAFPDQPWVTSWQDSLDLVGQALGRSTLAEEVLAETEASIAEAAEAHPELVGKSFVFASLSTTDMSKIDYYTPADNRPRLLTDLGMVNAPVIEEISEEGAFYGTISAERGADLESDVFITYAEADSDLAAFRKDPLLGKIPGIASGNVLASTDETDALGLSSPSPLSIPYAMEKFVPQIAEAVAGR